MVGLLVVVAFCRGLSAQENELQELDDPDTLVRQLEVPAVASDISGFSRESEPLALANLPTSNPEGVAVSNVSLTSLLERIEALEAQTESADKLSDGGHVDGMLWIGCGPECRNAT